MNAPNGASGGNGTGLVTNGSGRAVVAPPWDAESLDAQAVLALTLEVIGRERWRCRRRSGRKGS